MKHLYFIPPSISNVPCDRLLQDPALPGVGVLPDDGAEGHREAGWLAEGLHHLHAERNHRQPGLFHLPAVQSRGTLRLQMTTTEVATAAFSY